MNADIGGRVAQSIVASDTFETQKQVAGIVGMTPDAFSRAVNGARAFSSIELARVAEALRVDVHWLITGVQDPNRLTIAARHDYNFERGTRSNAGRTLDEKVLRDVGLAYRQAFTDGELPKTILPLTAEDALMGLGEGFVRRFADQLEIAYGVDVVRLPNLHTSYCLCIGGRYVIVLAATGNWFRENWSIAHELGHLACGHLDAHGEPNESDEASANAFAADLLLPADVLRAVDWMNLDEAGFAEWVWDAGVSTDALARRLSSLSIQLPRSLAVWSGQPTQRLLRRHWLPGEQDVDQITIRMDEASSRRFPIALQDAHLAAIAEGRLGKETLAWMLGINADDLEVDTPALNNSASSDELAEILGLQ